MRDATAQQELVTLGAAFRAVREQHCMTQADLSKASGLHRTTIARIERGLCDPRFDTLKALRRGLGRSLAEVFAMADEAAQHHALGHPSPTHPGPRGNPLGVSAPTDECQITERVAWDRATVLVGRR
jgi:transcriptional regulator with XRE-family HTH domain